LLLLQHRQGHIAVACTVAVKKGLMLMLLLLLLLLLLIILS
jgi:hypothetical protein